VLHAAVTLAVVTTDTKIATGWFAARREGVGVPGPLRAGTALVARGEFSIVIAGLAVTSGLPQVGRVATRLRADPGRDRAAAHPGRRAARRTTRPGAVDRLSPPGQAAASSRRARAAASTEGASAAAMRA